MRICVFSDVHGNIEALNKMYLREKDQVERFYFLGDIFGYFLEQIPVIETLMSMKSVYLIKGNHERNYILGLHDELKKKQFIEKYGLSYNLALSEKQLAFIGGLPEYRKEEIDNLKIGFFHGGPSDYLEQRVYPDSLLAENDFNGEFDLVFIGHTHYRFRKDVGSITVINPGSLGQPRDGKGFSYCVFDTVSRELTFKIIELDIITALVNVKKAEHESNNYLYLSRKYGWGKRE